jgi:hypothetical protein
MTDPARLLDEAGPQSNRRFFGSLCSLGTTEWWLHDPFWPDQ